MDEYDIESILDMYEDDYVKVADIKMSNKIPLLDRDNFNTSDLEQSPDSFLRPGETLEDFDVEFRRPNAQGGVQQLVQPSADGSRPGYAKDEKGFGQDAAPLTKEQKKNIKLYNKNVKKYGGVKFEDIPAVGKSNSDKRFRIKTGIQKGTGYDFDRSKIDYKESAAYKKSITPKGYISSTELFELINNPKLKAGNFQQARKFERNPKKYSSKKNYVYNYVKKLLNEKQVGKAGSKSLSAQKFFYKKPTKAELNKFNSFIDSRILETGTADNVKILHKEFGKLFEGKKTKGFFNDTLSLDKARAALKKYGINATDSQLARAMMRLGQVYEGHLFQNEINIPINKSAGRFIEKSFNELDLYHGWRSASYDAAMDDINKVMAKSSGDIRNFKYTLNNYIKENYPQIFKNYDVNEIFSLATSSVRGSYPYAYFIDLTKNDINQKALSSFQGKASIAEGKIQKAITNFRRTGNQKFYDEAIRVANVFNNTTRKNFLSDERIIKSGGVNALKLEIGSQQQIKDRVGFANEYYKNNNLKKWKDQGIDIDAHTAKSGYVKTFDGKTLPKEVVTFQDVVRDGKVDEKQFKNLLSKTLQNFEKHGCGKAAGGRILFAEGTPSGKPTKCAQKGIARFIDDLKKGNYSKATMDLLKGGGNVLKNIVNPMELIKLRNLIGPAAMGFMGLFEAGVITDDVIRQGTPLNESLANNWLTKSFLPYTKQYAQAKNLLETGKVPSNMKKYVEDVVKFNEALKEIQNIEGNIESRLVDQGGYGMIDGSSIYSQEQQEKDEADVMKKLSSITDYNFMSGSAKDLEYKKMLDEMEATRMAKKGFSPFFGFSKLKDVRTKDPTGILDYMDVPDPKEADLRPITYMDAEYEDLKKLPTAERKMYEDYFTEQGFLKPRQSLSELKFGDSNVYDEVLKDYNKFQRQKEASKYPGYYGTQYSEGGIASLNVNKK